MSLSAVVNTFAGSPLDRAAELRSDPERIAALAADPAARAVALCQGELMVQGERLAQPALAMLQALAPGEEPLLFLGLDKGAPVFAVDLDSPSDLGSFRGLRELAAELPAEEAAIAACARSVFEWRRRHRFCSACGEPSRIAEAGWKRVCTACAAEHFPRTDPVVIMLPVAGERCLLGRNRRFRPTLFSALAGFVEPGESIEEACARELAEEAGLTTISVRYHSSQPWPFPSSLMIGLIAEVVGAEARPDQTELEEVRWLSRAEARALIAGRHAEIECPPALAIAHQLIASFAAG